MLNFINTVWEDNQFRFYLKSVFENYCWEQFLKNDFLEQFFGKFFIEQ